MKNNLKLAAKNQVCTIPNLLSLFRIGLIPLFIWLYCIKQEFLWTAGILLLSGITDMVDGWVARRFHMISDVGKILDPVADKLTQGAMLLCLISRFPLMLAAFILLIIKELFAGVMGLLVIHRTGKVYGARWHGKAATCLLYAMMICHVVWPEIPVGFSNFIILFCIGMMMLSLILYGIQNVGALRRAKSEKGV